MTLNVVIHGYFGFGNIGDEAILAALIEEFKRMFSNVEFTVLSSNPARTTGIHKVSSIRER